MRRVLAAIRRRLDDHRGRRIAELEAELGPYTMYGDGPFGASGGWRQDQQLELAKLRQKLGLRQESNWLVAVALRVHGIKVAALLSAMLISLPASAFTGRIVNLGDSAITAAVTNQVITSGVSAQSVAIAYVDRLEGITALTFEANFTYSAGGTTLKVDLETSVDQGTNWLPICRIAFATSSALKVVNISGLTPKIAAITPAVPADDACTDGVLGDRFRVRITSAGTYSGNTLISTRASVR